MRDGEQGGDTQEDRSHFEVAHRLAVKGARARAVTPQQLQLEQMNEQ